ncbi:MAG TPA: BTAD domain-containing putative transcriptional regulator [Gemmatimonadaceae bacterium]|nr:BTAD domain-containing putative transcriptional regulator [Gemmatimonadaceae bacterium]
MFTIKLLGGASIDGPEGPVTGRATQRRRLALLALLAAARSRGLTRDKLVSYLWPESSTESARHLLSDSVYVLNRTLGEGAVVAAGDDLRLDVRMVACDAVQFEEALAAGDAARAVALYAGPFMDGFFVGDAPELERWIEGERERLARDFSKALELLAEERAAAGDRAGSLDTLRRLAAHDPYNSRIAVRLMQALYDAGDRAGALQHARVHTTLLEQEFGTEPSPELVSFVERIRQATTVPESVPRPPAPPAPTTPATDIRKDEAAAAPAAIASQQAMHRARRRAGHGVTVGVLLALIALTAVLALRKNGWRDDVPKSSAQPAIAVLPFADMSANRDQEYLGDGVAEELINALSRVEGLRVAARTSSFTYRSGNHDVREIGRRLGVGTVLQGSIRRSEERLRIGVQLVDVSTGYQMWSEIYERPATDVFAIQDEIARSVVQALETRLVDGANVAPIQYGTRDLEAYNLFLRARYAWHRRTRESLLRAAQDFEAVVARSPDYARAHAGLADAYAVLGFYDYLPPREAFPKARTAAERALALRPDLAAPHATLGYVALYYEWDFPRAEGEFRRAIEMDPGYSVGHQWYANFLTAMGRFEEGAVEMRRAQETDPLSLIANAALGWVFYYAGHQDSAVAQLTRTLELDDAFHLANLWRGLALEQQGKLDDAIAELRVAVGKSNGSAIYVAALARAHALAGARDSATAMLARLTSRRSGYVPAFETAKVHLALGDTAQTFRWLRRGLDERSHSMVFLKVDPQFASLREHPRMKELLREVGL